MAANSQRATLISRRALSASLVIRIDCRLTYSVLPPPPFAPGSLAALSEDQDYQLTADDPMIEQIEAATEASREKAVAEHPTSATDPLEPENRSRPATSRTPPSRRFPVTTVLVGEPAAPRGSQLAVSDWGTPALS